MMTNRETALRQLDALIAEKVLGWQSLGGDWIDFREQSTWRMSNWHPTEDWAAAGELMEKVRADEQPFLLEVHYECYYVSTGPGELISADTGPLAISLAVAKAYGIDVPSELQTS